MNKKQFLDELRTELRHLQKEDREEIIQDYEEYFSAGKKEGRTHSQIIKALGNPKTLARHLKADHYVKEAKKTKSASNILRAVFATLGVGFFNLIFVVAIFFSLLAVLISLYATSISLIVSGIASFIFGIISPAIPQITIGLNPFIIIFAGIGLASLGVLMFIGCNYVAKGFYFITIKYLQLNIKIIKGDESNE